MGLAEAIAEKLVPDAFRDFLAFVSPAGLKVIHKEKVLALSLSAIQRMMSHEEYQGAFLEAQESLVASGLHTRIRVVRSVDPSLNSPQWDAETKKRIGESILSLYFHLVGSAIPLFLDLRPSHFGWDPVERCLLWVPSRLNYGRSDEFRSLVCDLYRGFFENDQDASRRGLELYTWGCAANLEFQARVDELMKAHFGDARSSEVLFSIQHFKGTFTRIFEEAIRHRTRFHPELTFLGTTMVGLYLSLEKIQVPLDVKAAYRSGMKP